MAPESTASPTPDATGSPTPESTASPATESTASPAPESIGSVRLFLCGDLMTGRGLDQVLPHPGDPRLHEPYVRSATGYVELAEEAHGPIPAPVDFAYPWGDALGVLERAAPDLRIVNLETAVTRSSTPWKGKGIHYRMHPENVPVLTTAAVDACVLANNHVLDWGRAGLAETLGVLERAGLATAGAGRDREEARAPAVLEAKATAGPRREGREPCDRGPRVLLFALASPTAGVKRSWAAGRDRPGVDLLADLSPRSVRRMARRIEAVRRPGDVVVISLHWGTNWGYEVPEAQRRFARRLVEDAGADVVHGHSSHHPRGIGVHEGRPLLYGCGDFLNDYEGISGHAEFRPDLVLMYLVTVAPGAGGLRSLEMVPFRVRRFRLERARAEDARWLRDRMDRECRRLGGGRVELRDDGRLELRPEE